jgi:muramoyltetrapeptide carboxypeptidase LdcA involved in peptidoglycan recycling
VFELGLERMRAMGLEPVELPFTRVQGTPAERAQDLMAAYADETTEAVFSSIGGDDQIKVLKHLDPTVFQANPKPFWGYSDNTNLHNWLANLGVPTRHGGAVLVQWARPGRMHPVTAESLRRALFEPGPWQVPAPTDFTDVHEDWGTVDLEVEPATMPAEEWTWHGPPTRVAGRLWGGNLEILDWTLGVGTHVQPVEAYAGRVLLLETSEEMPRAEEVYRMLMVMGERGLLQQFAGLVFARPKAWMPDQTDVRASYTADQHAAVLRAMEEYAPDTPWVYGVDAGHADPMVVMPLGDEVVLDPAAGTVTVTY